MIKSKKGAEIALNTVIIAILALIVLAVLVIILLPNLLKFNNGVSECEGLGGHCSLNTCITPLTAGNCTSKGEGYNCCLVASTT